MVYIYCVFANISKYLCATRVFRLIKLIRFDVIILYAQRYTTQGIPKRRHSRAQTQITTLTHFASATARRLKRNCSIEITSLNQISTNSPDEEKSTSTYFAIFLLPSITFWYVPTLAIYLSISIYMYGWRVCRHLHE